MVKFIQSWQNPFFKKIQKLNQSKYLKQWGKYVLGGDKIIKEILQNPDRAKLSGWIVQKESEVPKTQKDYPVYCLSKELWQKIDFFLTPPPLALLDLPVLTLWQNQKSLGINLFLPLQDPGNMGTALRSAHAFGVKNVVLLKEASFPFLPKAARSAGSALWHLKFFQGPSLKELLKNPPENTYLLDVKGEDIRKLKKPKNLNLVVGLEGLGFSVGIQNNLPRISIPISQEQNSLNAAVALSIALFVLTNP